MNRLENWDFQVGALCLNPEDSPCDTWDLRDLYWRVVYEGEDFGKKMASFRNYLINVSNVVDELYLIELAAFQALLSKFHPQRKITRRANWLAKNLYEGIAKQFNIKYRGKPPRCYIDRKTLAFFSWGLEIAQSISQDYPILAIPPHDLELGGIGWGAFVMEVAQRFFLDQMKPLLVNLEEKVNDRLEQYKRLNIIEPKEISEHISGAVAMIYLGPEYIIATICYARALYNVKKMPYFFQKILVAERILHLLQPEETYPFFDFLKKSKVIKQKQDLAWRKCIDCIILALKEDRFDAIEGKTMKEFFGPDAKVPCRFGKDLVARHLRILFEKKKKKSTLVKEILHPSRV